MAEILVSQWRIYCIDEGNWIESWSTVEPTLCANSTSHLVNPNSVQLLQTIDNQDVDVSNTYQDLLESARVVQQTPIIDLKSFHGITKENKTSITGNATVTASSEVDSEIKLNINGTSAICSLRSAERGYYTAGLVSECGIAIRIPEILYTTQELKFGYYDDSNGYYFKLVGNSLSVGIMYNGNETLITRDNFNKNRLDGSADLLLDLAKGNIFRITFTWYGFGNVTFGVIQTDMINEQRFIPMHTYTTDGNTSCGNPYLPINIKLSSNGSTQDKSVYVGGRQYCVLGKPIDNTYKNMYYATDSATINTSTKYLFSIKNKTNYKTCISKIVNIRALSTSSAIVKILKNATLTSSSFINNPYVEETALSVDTSASLTGGTVCKTFLLFANTELNIEIKDMNIYEDDTISIVWNSITGTSTFGIQLDYTEKW